MKLSQLSIRNRQSRQIRQSIRNTSQINNLPHITSMQFLTWPELSSFRKPELNLPELCPIKAQSICQSFTPDSPAHFSLRFGHCNTILMHLWVFVFFSYNRFYRKAVAFGFYDVFGEHTHEYTILLDNSSRFSSLRFCFSRSVRADVGLQWALWVHLQLCVISYRISIPWLRLTFDKPSVKAYEVGGLLGHVPIGRASLGIHFMVEHTAVNLRKHISISNNVASAIYEDRSSAAWQVWVDLLYL